MSDQQIIELLNRFFQGEITSEEKEKLSHWIQESGNEAKLEALMAQAWQQFKPQQTLPSSKAKSLLKTILERNREAKKSSVKPIKLLHKGYRIAAAASIILLLGFAIYFWINRSTKINQVVPQLARQDIVPPQTLNAVLTLGNGERILLEDTFRGVLAIEGTVNISKHAGGQIAYRSDIPDHDTEVMYHTLTIPRGSKTLKIELADGTRVWMNSASSLRYPNLFTGKQRQVEIKGEAYFEVAKNEDMPFIVKVNNKAEIKVLGTHFNVSAYDDESTIKTTLLEGSVRVSSSLSHSVSSSPRPSVILSPNQQASLDASGKLNVEKVDPEEAIAWKNGMFDFKEADIRTIMRQLARWYDLKVEYEEEITEKFYVKMSRNTNISNVFKILEATGAVNFRIEGKKITII